MQVASLPFGDTHGTLERQDQLTCVNSGQMIRTCVPDHVVMAALVQRREIFIEENTKLRPSGLALWVGFELTEEKPEDFEERGGGGDEQKSQEADLRP